ncbi:MAG: leucine zipper domain-containing protein [Rhodospirillales bacterium]
MDIHPNARTTRHSRMLVVQRLANGWSAAAIATAQRVSVRPVRKWRDRFAAEGEAGLADRSSRPRRSPRLARQEEDEIVPLRRQRMTGSSVALSLRAS